MAQGKRNGPGRMVSETSASTSHYSDADAYSSCGFGGSDSIQSSKSNFKLKPPPLLVLELFPDGNYRMLELENEDILIKARSAVPKTVAKQAQAEKGTDNESVASDESSGLSKLDATSSFSSYAKSSHAREHLEVRNRQQRLAGTLQPRDIRLFDPNFSHSHDPEILVRRHAVLVNMDPVKALVLHDRCLVIVPDGADSLLSTILLTSADLASETLLEEQKDNGNENGKLALESGNISNILSGMGSRTPFELRSYESILLTVCSLLENEFAEVRPSIENAINRLLQTTAGVVLEKLRQLDADLVRLAAKVEGNTNALREVLASDRSMALMRLTALQRFPERFLDTLLDHWQFDHEEVELIIEAYLQRLEAISTGIEELQDRLSQTRASTSLRLSTAQNRLLSLDLLVSSVTAAGTFGALSAAVFGMNLTSGVEEAPYWFWSVFGIIGGGVPLCILGIFYCIKRKGLLIT